MSADPSKVSPLGFILGLIIIPGAYALATGLALSAIAYAWIKPRTVKK